MTDINALRERFKDADTQLRDRQRDLQAVGEERTQIEQQLTGLGLDPKRDWGEQVKEKEEELDGLIGEAESLVADIALAIPEGTSPEAPS